jgi:hypothetical protein
VTVAEVINPTVSFARVINILVVATSYLVTSARTVTLPDRIVEITPEAFSSRSQKYKPADKAAEEVADKVQVTSPEAPEVTAQVKEALMVVES